MLMIGPFLESCFNTLLKVHEVNQFAKLLTMFADARTGVAGGEEQAGFRYRTAGSVVYRGELRRRSVGQEQAPATGEAIRVGSCNQLQPTIALNSSQHSQADQR